MSQAAYKKHKIPNKIYNHLEVTGDEELKMISNLPPSKAGFLIVLIISYANINGFTIFETFLGPIIQYQGNYIRDPNDLNCGYVYLLYAAFGFASLFAVLV